MKKEKKAYTAPELTVVTFKTERGYAASYDMNAMSFLGVFGLNSGSYASSGGGLETWEEDNSYSGSGWF